VSKAASQPVTAKIDLLADPARLEAGTADGAAYVDLARPSGLWILRGRESWRAWKTSRVGGLEGIALGAEPLMLRIGPGEANGRCMKLLVGSSGGAKLQVSRVAGGRTGAQVEAGASLVDGPCPSAEESVQDFSVKAGGADAVLAGVWLAPAEAAVPQEPPSIAACKGGVEIAPGASVTASALAPPGSKLKAVARGQGAGQLGITVLRDAAAPLEVEMSQAKGAHRGRAKIAGDRPAAIEVEASLPAGAAGAACLGLRLSYRAPPAQETDRDRTFDAVVLVVSDTMRGDLYPYENSGFGVEMPRVQALASHSTVFAQATAHSSYTKPSVGTILTGLYPDQHGGLPRKAPIADSATLVSEILEKAGVRTVAFLSNFFFNPSFGMRRGWSEEHFIDPWGAALDDDIVLEEFEKWAAAGAPQGPLFVYVHLMAAHAPYTPPDRIRKAFFQGESLAKRIVPRHTAQLIKDLTSGKEPRLSKREKAQLKRLYRADASYHDEVMDRLLDALDASGLMGRALLIYTSDHGEEFYEHGRVGHGTGLWHEQVHIPLIMHAPGQTRGASVTAPAGHVDIAPTILEAMGVEVPASLPGRSLLDDPAEGRPLLMMHWTGRWGVQTGPWKLQRRLADERLSLSWLADEEEIPLSEAPLLHRLLRRHLAWGYVDLGAEAQAGKEFEVSPELQDQLEKLGYIIR
jgi:arylsulfatase A-like enzyme